MKLLEPLRKLEGSETKGSQMLFRECVWQPTLNPIPLAHRVNTRLLFRRPIMGRSACCMARRLFWFLLASVSLLCKGSRQFIPLLSQVLNVYCRSGLPNFLAIIAYTGSVCSL